MLNSFVTSSITKYPHFLLKSLNLFHEEISMTKQNFVLVSSQSLNVHRIRLWETFPSFIEPNRNDTWIQLFECVQWPTSLRITIMNWCALIVQISPVEVSLTAVLVVDIICWGSLEENMKSVRWIKVIFHLDFYFLRTAIA